MAWLQFLTVGLFACGLMAVYHEGVKGEKTPPRMCVGGGNAGIPESWRWL
jgi:hypothetical protein